MQLGPPDKIVTEKLEINLLSHFSAHVITDRSYVNKQDKANTTVTRVRL